MNNRVNPAVDRPTRRQTAASRPSGIAAQLPILELVRGHLVGVEEDRANDHEVDPERDVRGNDPPTTPRRTSDRLGGQPPGSASLPSPCSRTARHPRRRSRSSRWRRRLPCRDAAAGPSTSRRPAVAPSACSGPRLAPPISDTAETATIPGTSPVSTSAPSMSSMSPGISRGASSRTQQADHDAGPCRDCDPPPVAPEPARIRNVVPVVASIGHAQEHWTGHRADDPEQQTRTPSGSRTHRVCDRTGPGAGSDAELIGGRYRDCSDAGLVASETSTSPARGGDSDLVLVGAATSRSPDLAATPGSG